MLSNYEVCGAQGVVSAILVLRMTVSHPSVFDRRGKEGVGYARDYVHVRDVVAACVAAWQSAVGGGEIINIGNGRQISINDIARMLGGPTKTIPERKGEMRFIEASNAKAKRLLKWKPKVKFEDGLRELVGS